MAPRLELFAFRYRDARTGKWIRARYRAERHEIAARYVEWEIIGPPEIRDVDPEARYFNPHQPFMQMMNAEMRRYTERAPEFQPAIDAAEAFLLRVFLRRYVTYCARRRRFAAMNAQWRSGDQPRPDQGCARRHEQRRARRADQSHIQAQNQ